MFLLLSPVLEATHSLIALKSPWPNDSDSNLTHVCPTSMSEYIIKGNNMVKDPLPLLCL